MQFKFVERGSDKRDGLLKARHRTNRAHPLFCEVRLPSRCRRAAQWFFKFTFDQPLE